MSSVEADPAFRMLIEDGSLAIHTHNIGLRRIPVAHMRHIAHIDHRAIHRT